MIRLAPYRADLMKYLAESANAAAYINAEVEEGDMFYLLNAIRNVVAANGGMGKLAKATGRSRTSLYKTLSRVGNPEFSTLQAILAVYGIRIGCYPAPSPAQPRPHRHGGRGRHLHL